VSDQSWSDWDQLSGAALLGAQFAARAAGDIDAFALLLTPDVQWHVPGDSAIAGDYRGVEDVIALVQVRLAMSGGTISIGVEDIVANDRHGLVVASASARLRGRWETWRTQNLYRFRDWKIAECWVVPDDPREFDRIWAEAESAP
jgi:hypothetical protein